MITVDASVFREVRPSIARLRDEAVAAGLRLVHVQNAAMLLMRHRFDLARSDEIVATCAESARLPAGLLAGDRLMG